MKLLQKKITGAAVALLLVSSSASAIVTEWGYNVASQFTAATYINGTGTTGVDALSWGTTTGFGQSSLVVGGSPASGSVDTWVGLTTPPQSAPFLADSTSLTHNNRPVTGSSLTSAVLTNTVTLTPIVPSQASLPNQIVPFTIAFAETTNSLPCAVSGSPTPCNDIFVLTAGLTNFSFYYDAGDLDGLRQYFVNIFPTSGGVLSSLPTNVCDAALPGTGNSCIGFTTPENASTELAFGFTISTERLQQQVPEPGILALFGIGLVGLFARRRRQS